MAELFDAGRVPDTPEHWDALAKRVAAHAALGSQRNLVEWLATSRISWMVGAALLLSAAMLNLGSVANKRSAEWTQLVAPSDEMGRAIVLQDRPPHIGTLLLPDRPGS